MGHVRLFLLGHLNFDMWCREDGRDKGVSYFLTHQKKRTNGRSCWIWEGDGGSVRIPCCCNLPYLETVGRVVDVGVVWFLLGGF